MINFRFRPFVEKNSFVGKENYVLLGNTCFDKNEKNVDVNLSKDSLNYKLFSLRGIWSIHCKHKNKILYTRITLITNQIVQRNLHADTNLRFRLTNQKSGEKKSEFYVFVLYVLHGFDIKRKKYFKDLQILNLAN